MTIRLLTQAQDYKYLCISTLETIKATCPQEYVQVVDKTLQVCKMLSRYNLEDYAKVDPNYVFQSPNDLLNYSKDYSISRFRDPNLFSETFLHSFNAKYKPLAEKNIRVDITVFLDDTCNSVS